MSEKDILAEICQEKRKHIHKAKRAVSEQELLRSLRHIAPPRPFRQALQEKLRANTPALIAEIKKASPSRGIIRQDFQVGRIAEAYASAGAACLSVLTDTPYFQGSNYYVHLARTQTPLPVLRKDFMLEPYQIVESRSIGADCVLLILAALTDGQASELEATALELEMDVLIETHDAAELERAMKLRSPLVGINNRNLRTLEVDITTTETLAGRLPDGYLPVCESGIGSATDIARMRKANVHTFLVGESLMAAPDIALATRNLLASA